jgi:RNA polymerase sigma-70 factor (ECF subfamily)
MQKSRQLMDITCTSNSEPAALIGRFQSGELDAFDQIVDRYQDYVYSLAYQFTRNCDDAYDISQEVFVKVFKSLGGLRDNSTFNSWLRRVTVNACIDYLRQRSNGEGSSDALDMQYMNTGGSAELPDSPMQVRELQDVILKAVDRLPEKQRKVFVLRHYKHLSLEEIASTMNRSQGTVKANLFHATRRLRKLLESYLDT